VKTQQIIKIYFYYFNVLKNKNYKVLLTGNLFSPSLPLSFSISLSFSPLSLFLSLSLSQNQIESEMKKD